MSKEPVLIFDYISGKMRKVRDLEVVSHETHGLEGPESFRCVEFTVIGTNRNWRRWLPYEEFKLMNPSIEV